MSDLIATLTDEVSGLGASSILSVVTDIVPYIVVIVPVALGIYFLRKLVKGTSKGKVRF